MEPQTDASPSQPRKRPLLRRLLVLIPVAIGGLLTAAWIGSRRPTVEPTVAAGDQAPDWAFTSADDSSVQLSSLWAKGPLVIIWLRHYG